MRLEERIPCEEFNQDTPDTPNVTRKTPTQVEDDLRCPIVSRRDYRGMVLIVEGGGTKIDQPNLTVKEDPSLPSITGVCVRGGGDGAVVGESLVVVADEEDVLRFQVGMDEVEIVKN